MTNVSEKILDTLDRLRAKPLHVRKRIAVLSTAVISILILTIWWNSWSVDTVPNQAEKTAQAVSPWDVVWESMASIKEGTVAMFADRVDELKANDIEYAAGDVATELLTTTETPPALEPTPEDETLYSGTGEESASSEGQRTRPKALESVAATGAVE